MRTRSPLTVQQRQPLLSIIISSAPAAFAATNDPSISTSPYCKSNKELSSKDGILQRKNANRQNLKNYDPIIKRSKPGLLIRFDLTKLVEPFSKLFTMFQRSELRSFLFRQLKNKQTATKTFTCNRMSEASEKLQPIFQSPMSTIKNSLNLKKWFNFAQSSPYVHISYPSPNVNDSILRKCNGIYFLSFFPNCQGSSKLVKAIIDKDSNISEQKQTPQLQ